LTLSAEEVSDLRGSIFSLLKEPLSLLFLVIFFFLPFGMVAFSTLVSIFFFIAVSFFRP